MDIPLDEVIYFDCITTHPTTGAATDADSTPTFAVYEESTDTDIGVGGNLTKRTSLTGNYRGSFTASAANGFEVGKWYSVIGSATVNSIAGKAVLRGFRIVAAEAIAGKPKADVDAFGGSAGTFASGIPAVNATQVSGDSTAADTLELFAEALDQATGQLDSGSLAAGTITAAAIAASALDNKGNWNVGKTGYTLTATTGLGNQTADITGTITTVTNLTNLPAISANWLTAAGLAPDAAAEIAAAVRTEHAIELARIDQKISDQKQVYRG